jgi:hypothetical protein
MVGEVTMRFDVRAITAHQLQRQVDALVLAIEATGIAVGEIEALACGPRDRDAAEVVSVTERPIDAPDWAVGVQSGLKGLREIFERQVRALNEALVPTPSGSTALDVTLDDWLKMIEAIGVKCQNLRRLRAHFESEIRGVDMLLAEFSPAEPEVKR